MNYWSVSKSLHSDKHYDDHLVVKIFDEEQYEGVAVIADGVSNSSGGRIAAIMACKVIPNFIYQNRGKVKYNNPFELIEDALRETGCRLKELGVDLIEGKSNFEETLEEVESIEERESFIKLKGNDIQKKIDNGDIPEFESTAVVAYFNGNNLYLSMVGDGLLVHIAKGATYTFPQSKGPLRTFLSSKDGYIGPSRKLHFEISEGDVFILGSDGGCFYYSGESGAPLSPLKNILLQSVNDKKFQEFSGKYYEYLKREEIDRGVEIIDDDFSMIALRLMIAPSKERVDQASSLNDVISIIKRKIESLLIDDLEVLKKRAYETMEKQSEDFFERNHKEIQDELRNEFLERIESWIEKFGQKKIDSNDRKQISEGIDSILEEKRKIVK